MSRVQSREIHGQCPGPDPCLSVVLTSYNYARFLGLAIEGILGQTRVPDEFIVIDDASTDESVKIINKYAQANPSIQLVKNEQNEGIVACLNKGMDLARGKYLLYATADDVVLPGLCEESITLLEQHPEAPFSSALVSVIDEEGLVLGRWPSPVVAEKGFIGPQDALRLMRKFGFWLSGNTVVFRRQALIEVGGFPSELGPLCDSFVSRVMALRHGACFIPKELACLRRSKRSYGISTLGDTGRSMEILQNMQGLIDSRYRDLFSADDAERMKREWRYNMGRFAAAKQLLKYEEYLASLRQVLLPPTFPDRLLLSALHALERAKVSVVQVYLFLRLRRLTCNQIKRHARYRVEALLSGLRKRRHVR